ncbi:MAG: glycosyltransferase family 2 protein, partial [Sphingobacteriales bacterium]|nr:glycosyltransferase family 2 protein [Sphingobacteriales bacterium]
MTANRQKGISVIMCCYNSANRIKETLSALAHQQIDEDIQFEIVLVDNASTDNTVDAAKKIWENLKAPYQLRCTYEAIPGLGNARMKGIQEASYDTIIFCDDDNWLMPNYIQGVFKILETNPSIAACGGTGIPIFETKKPEWFDEYAESFAIGSQDINREEGKL